MKLLDDRILVKRIESDNTTKSGLIMPDDEKEMDYFTVEDVGKTETVKKGQTVVLPIDAPIQMHIEGEKFGIAYETDVVAVCE